MGVTDDRNDPALTHGADDHPVPMADKYLVLSERERAKGFVRPLRTTYIHVGRPGPTYDLFDLTDDQRARQLADTLLHELTHAILRTIDLSTDDGERVALAMGPGLLALLRDNPRLVDYLKECA